tara:strand:- start:767 stop:1471 length:705 start_codon:yes stop_codon:yes gene_type:complete
MATNLKFETFLYLSPNKISLYVNQKKDFRSIYKDEVSVNNISNELNLEKIDKFLSEKIFKVEKDLNSFIQNISVVIFSEDIFKLKISVKRNNHNEIIKNSSLIYLLNEAKDDCKKSIKDKKIIHILIDNYLIDNESYIKLPDNIKCKNFSLDLSFICLSVDLVANLEKILEKYQISVNQFLSADYIEKFSKKENLDFFQSMSKIIDGSNSNEVKLVQKISKNKGFFEKFFDFFN